MLGSDAITFPGLLDGFVVHPGRQSAVFQIGERGVILFGQCCGEKPGDHHVDIIFFRADRSGPIEIFRMEALLKEMIHQAAQAETDGKGQPGCDPPPDIGFEGFGIAPKAVRAHAVAGGPVIT